MFPSRSAPSVEMEDTGFSFAAEYDGPPLPYDIPRVIPIDVSRIPLAAFAPSPADPNRLPIVLPLPSPKKPLPLPPPSGPACSPTSVIENHVAVGSGALDSSGFRDVSTELSEVANNSGAVGFSEELRGDPNRLSAESTLSSGFSFRSSATEIKDEDEAVDTQPENSLFVTFQESGWPSCTVSPAIGVASRVKSEELEIKVKKGACYSCLKGSRFTDKEACLACAARYCSGCVLVAMGSMPEGRKCISCIGSPILELNRARLGKSSHLLKRLLSAREVEQVLRAEKNCEANQLRPEDICVNGEELSLEEMILLQTCPCPPKLKPGSYWYDKVCGYWGKAGHKPDKIITPKLNVGGPLMKNASNGNAGIQINGREITKTEQQMLKWAGIPCDGKPHFWVYHDGTYMEEGQKQVKGKIWGKRMKFLGPVFSLPFPNKDANSSSGVNDLMKRTVFDYLDRKTSQKLLLIGNDGSGTSTIFKQAKLLYSSVPFSKDERQEIKLMIQTSIFTYFHKLLEFREWFEEDALSRTRDEQEVQSAGDAAILEKQKVTEFSISPPLKEFSDWMLEVMASGDVEATFPDGKRAALVEELWKDSAIQATYTYSNELQAIPETMSYFLERAVDISRVDYEPSYTDILYADGINFSNALACTDFHFPQPSAGSSSNEHDQQETSWRYQLIRVRYKGDGENCKWLDMFENVGIVIFCIAMTDYDKYRDDMNGSIMNKMLESRKLFESIASHPAFENKDFLLILSKFDLFVQRINTSPLTSCEWFDDFNPVISKHQPNDSSGRTRSIRLEATKAEQSFHYIAKKFMRLFFSWTGKKLYVTWTNGLDANSVDAALRYATEIVKWREEWLTYGSVESMYSCTEPSSFFR